MGLLGEMLVERGAISVDQLQKGLTASRRGGQRLGSSLLDFGFVDEGALLQALADQHGVPFISEAALLECLEQLDAAVLPETMLRRLRAVPFRRVRDRVQVAMSSPADAGAIDRIANFTQLHVEPFVTSDRTIERALERAPKLREVVAVAEEELLTEIVHVEDGAEAWEHLWTPQLQPAALLRARSRPKAARVVHVASFPNLEPLDSGPGTGRAVDDDKEFLRALGTMSTAAEVGEALVRFAARFLDRVCLFAVHHGRASGWIGRGLPLDAAALRGFSVAESAPSLFRMLGRGDRYVGRVPSSPVDDRLLEVFGPPPPTEVLLVPVMVRGRAKGYLVGDSPGRPVDSTALDAVLPAARAAGDALVVVLRGRL